jgi:pyruvate formate-lyase/glycerol dehydratase family glycyl radical enzyme
MRERIESLRDETLNARPSVSHERARLLTEYWRSSDGDGLSVPVRRAMAFKYILENRSIYIGDVELIVGEKGTGPKASPTYPELCCHSIADLETLSSRSRVAFDVSDETREVYQNEIIPFWGGKTQREEIIDAMSDEWKLAYETGVFTEFMEQRSPGHAVLDGKIYRKGLLEFKEEISTALDGLDGSDPESADKEQELKAMSIAVDAVIAFGQRHAERARELHDGCTDSVRKAELKDIVDVCSQVPARAPRTFREALQHYWFMHLGITTEMNPWDSFSPGRLDQHLYPFYKHDLAEGMLTRDDAEELLQCFWIKFNNQPAPPKVGVTARESGTYNDFAQINVGGLTPDGADAVNEVSYLILDVVQEMQLIQPNPSVHISSESPDEFVVRSAEVIREGFGQPSVFNAEQVIKEMLRQGKSLEDARCGGTGGCVETSAFGKENSTLSGYFSLPKVVELTLFNGIDPSTDQRVGLGTGEVSQFATFDDFMAAYRKQLEYFLKMKMEANNVIGELYAKRLPAPFMSVLVDDCVSEGKDYHQGGARYNTTYIQCAGIGTATDSLCAIKTHVFDEKSMSMAELLTVLGSNFRDQEALRLRLLNRTAHFGNDDDRADSIAQDIFNMYLETVDGVPNERGGEHRMDVLSTTVHVHFGSKLGASPDGRFSGVPISEGISPVQGTDLAGPTAVAKSVAKLNHGATGGTLLNQKFTPQLLKSAEDLEKLTKLIRTYFKLGGHHMQFNVIDRETLKKAQQDPEAYRSLIVRVAGYSDYFRDLSESLQNEIIARTEHAEF